jgi:CBS domain containing-hemolysin-like protein
VARDDFGLEAPISTWLALSAALLLVLANGFFVATEFALVSVRRTRMQQLAAEGKRGAHQVLDRLDHLDSYIAATQLGITIASIGLGWIGEPAIADLVEPVLARAPGIPERYRAAAEHSVAFGLAFALITTLHIVFGELAPKSLALQRPESTALRVAAPIRWFLVVFRPIVHVLNAVGNRVVQLVGIEPAAGHALVQSAEELQLAVDASREAGLLDQAAHDLVDRAFAFTGLSVRQVMVPRTEMTAIPLDASLDDLLRLAGESGHTRLPVYRGNNDSVVGVISLKRVLPVVRQRCVNDAGMPAPFDLRDFMVEPMVVPETVSAPSVLAAMREHKTQIALVIDEFGGTAGLVTLEDLVESVVGEIGENLDESMPVGQIDRDGSMVIDGLTTLVDAGDMYGLDLMHDALHAETVGGYVFFRLGRVARVGDQVRSASGARLQVEAMDGLRVSRVRVLPP